MTTPGRGVPEPKDPRASRLRQRKRTLLDRLTLPGEGLPGSLALSYTRCGKATCHCARGEGHPSWSLTFMVDGRKRVERIPAAWVEEIRQRVEAGRRFKDAVGEVFVLNAELVVLARQQRRRRR